MRRGANCWTDHMLVIAKVNVMLTHHARKNIVKCKPFVRLINFE